jgi:hypothetical protein
VQPLPNDLADFTTKLASVRLGFGSVGALFAPFPPPTYSIALPGYDAETLVVWFNENIKNAG